MAEAATRTRAIINSHEQHDVLSRYARGQELNTIAAETGHLLDLVSGIVSTLAGFDRGRARSLVQAYERTRRPAEQPVVNLRVSGTATAAELADRLPTEPAAAAEPPPADTIADQLDRASATGDAKLVKLVDRVRGLLDEIGQRHTAIAAELDAAADVTKARAALDAALAKLREVRGGPATPPAPAKPRMRTSTSTAQIRAWATANGHRVSAKGLLPADVIRAYEEANGG